jgi:hypothetical protein
MQRPRVLAALFCAMILVLALPTTTFADTSFGQFLGQLEQQYNLPSGILWKVALAENGGKATGCAPTSSACGMFQFTTNTWLSVTKALFGQPLDLSSRNSPDISAKATAFELAEINTQIGSVIAQAKVNQAAGLYLGHFLGSGGAKQLLLAYIQNPGQSACAILPKACAANRSIMSGTVAAVINYCAQKMSVTGVPNVAGNFQDSQGISYAYSTADISSTSFLPANTVIGVDPQYDYPPVFTSVTNAPLSPTTGTGMSLPNAPQTTPPASYTNPPPVVSPSTTVTPTNASSSSSACTPQYSCSNNTVYYESDSCTRSVFQMCKYGCLGTICAPAPSASSSASLLSQQPLTTSVATSAFGILGTTLDQLFATSSAIGTTTSLTLNGSMYSVVPEGTPTSLSGATTSGLSNQASTSQDDAYFAADFSQSNYVPQSASPLSRALGELRTALGGFLNYLRSL